MYPMDCGTAWESSLALAVPQRVLHSSQWPALHTQFTASLPPTFLPLVEKQNGWQAHSRFLISMMTTHHETRGVIRNWCKVKIKTNLIGRQYLLRIGQ